MDKVQPATDDEVTSLRRWCGESAPKAESWQTIARLLARLDAAERQRDYEKAIAEGYAATVDTQHAALEAAERRVAELEAALRGIRQDAHEGLEAQLWTVSLTSLHAVAAKADDFLGVKP